MYKKTNHMNNKIYYNIHAKNKSALPPLPYITWGLMWDFITKRRDSDIYVYKINTYKKKRKRKKKKIIIKKKKGEDI